MGSLHDDTAYVITLLGMDWVRAHKIQTIRIVRSMGFPSLYGLRETKEAVEYYMDGPFLGLPDVLTMEEIDRRTAHLQRINADILFMQEVLAEQRRTLVDKMQAEPAIGSVIMWTYGVNNERKYIAQRVNDGLWYVTGNPRAWSWMSLQGVYAGLAEGNFTVLVDGTEQ